MWKFIFELLKRFLKRSKALSQYYVSRLSTPEEEINEIQFSCSFLIINHFVILSCIQLKTNWGNVLEHYSWALYFIFYIFT